MVLKSIKVALESPDEKTAFVMELLSNLPHIKAHTIGFDTPATLAPGQATEELPEAEQHRLLHEIFGSWKPEESGEEMVRRLYADRQDQPREVDL